MIEIQVKEQSRIAAIAARVLKVNKVAIVIGRTIHLHNTSCKDFTCNQQWLLHELKHVEQFQQHGRNRFMMLYLIESLRKGYYKNKYEVEARAAEGDASLLAKYAIQSTTST